MVDRVHSSSSPPLSVGGVRDEGVRYIGLLYLEWDVCNYRDL